MIISTSSFQTGHAFDYLRELCIHFAKRVPVDVAVNQACVTLPNGTCDLTANGRQISAKISAEKDHIDRMERVFGGWIERIAFRENAVVTWQRNPRQTNN